MLKDTINSSSCIPRSAASTHATIRLCAEKPELIGCVCRLTRRLPGRVTTMALLVSMLLHSSCHAPACPCLAWPPCVLDLPACLPACLPATCHRSRSNASPTSF